MSRDELHPVDLPQSARRETIEGLAVRSDEPERAIIEYLYHDPALVQLSMMEAAK